MKRKHFVERVLGLAITLSLLASADVRAVNLSADGLGQVLLFPYYTVNQGNSTLISLVNTTTRVKAVKVRFREGRNGREALVFNVYLSPYDVWTTAVFASDQDGPARLLTRDESCTAPLIKHNATLPQTAGGDRYVPFRDAGYTDGRDDHGGAGLDRTREGFLEVIEMGELSEGPSPTQLAEEATHIISTDMPANCAALDAAWLVGGGWLENSRADIGLPNGGLRGTASIVDVANGTLHTYTPEAIENFYTNAADPGRLNAAPGASKPDLADADNGGGIARSYVFAGTAPTVSDWPVGTANAVSALFMHDGIINEFNSEPALGASSEWVVTFPTKSYYTDNGAALAPFTDTFTDDGRACESVAVKAFSREEQPSGELPRIDFATQPAEVPDGKPRLCFAAQVVAFNQEAPVTAGASRIFGSRYAANVNLSLCCEPSPITHSGWARITFDDPEASGFQNELVAGMSTGYVGLPVIGFWAANFVNAAAQPGKLANYSGALRHAGTRLLEVDF